MSGQFFIIGALFVCILLFLGVAPAFHISQTNTADMDRLLDNLEIEFPRALNIGINTSKPQQVLYNFTNYTKNHASGKRINFSCYWVTFIQEAGNVNVSVGNFLHQAKDFSIGVWGTAKNIYVGYESVNSSLFAVPKYYYNVTITVDSDVESFELLANKTSLYSIITLERNGNTLKKKILA